MAVPGQPTIAREIANASERARSLGLDMSVIWVSDIEETEAAFATLAQKRGRCLPDDARAVLRPPAPCRRATVYPFIQDTQSGGLLSYDASLTDRSYQAGVYVGLILNGQKPGDLPVRRLTRFELAINTATAKALGLTVPASFLALTAQVHHMIRRPVRGFSVVDSV